MAAKLKCNGRQATLEEVPFCFDGEDWSGVTLQEFMNCPHNLGNNRQARMLANLSLAGCYNQSAMPLGKRDEILLQSAKDNLKNMAFFGLTEYQTYTQFMFEKTFKLRFVDDFIQYNATHANQVHLSEKDRQRIIEINRLDIKLYQYAKDLFFQRYNSMKFGDNKDLYVYPSKEADQILTTKAPVAMTMRTPVAKTTRLEVSNLEYDSLEEDRKIVRRKKKRKQRQQGRRHD